MEIEGRICTSVHPHPNQLSQTTLKWTTVTVIGNPKQSDLEKFQQETRSEKLPLLNLICMGLIKFGFHSTGDFIFFQLFFFSKHPSPRVDNGLQSSALCLKLLPHVLGMTFKVENQNGIVFTMTCKHLRGQVLTHPDRS